jgi:hypothetical protein
MPAMILEPLCGFLDPVVEEFVSAVHAQDNAIMDGFPKVRVELVF